MEVLEESRRGHAKCTGDAENVEQAHISLSALNPAQVRPVDPGPVCKLLLRHAEPLALCTDAGSKAFEVCLAHERGLSRGEVYQSTDYE